MAKGAIESGAFNEDRLPASVKKSIIVIALALMMVMLFVGWSYPRSAL
jgi:hypothetical protein